MPSIKSLATKAKSEIQTWCLMFLLLPLLGSMIACWPDKGETVAKATETLVIANKETVLQVKDLALIKIPAGAFPREQRVKILKTSDKETAEDFETSISMYPGVSVRAPYEIRVNTGNIAPAKPILVEITVPEDMNNRFSKGGTVKAFVQFFYDGENETLDHFEIVDSSYDAKTRSIRVTLEPDAFTDLRNPDRSFEAIIVIAGLSLAKANSK